MADNLLLSGSTFFGWLLNIPQSGLGQKLSRQSSVYKPNPLLSRPRAAHRFSGCVSQHLARFSFSKSTHWMIKTQIAEILFALMNDLINDNLMAPSVGHMVWIYSRFHWPDLQQSNLHVLNGVQKKKPQNNCIPLVLSLNLLCQVLWKSRQFARRKKENMNLTCKCLHFYHCS